MPNILVHQLELDFASNKWPGKRWENGIAEGSW